MASLQRLSDKELLKRHAVLHTIYSRLVQGLKQGDWTIDKVKKEHELAAKEIERRGLKHESPIETGRPDHSSHTRHDIGSLDDSTLLRLHANLHSLAIKIQEGVVGTGWTMDQLIREHEDVVVQMIGRGMEHNSPIE